MNEVKKLFGGDTRQFGMIFALVALIIFFQISTGGLTLTPDNVINLFQRQLLHPGPGHRHGARHHRRPHRPLGRFGRGVRRHRASPSSMRDWGLPWYVGILLGLVLGAARRRLAGLLDRLRRHPRLHRDAGRHAALPRRQPVRRQVQHRPGPRRLPGTSAPATCPRSGPNTGYNNLTVLIGPGARRRHRHRCSAQPSRRSSSSAPRSRTPGSCACASG